MSKRKQIQIEQSISKKQKITQKLPTQKLPTEIIFDILKYCLLIVEDDFSEEKPSIITFKFGNDTYTFKHVILSNMEPIVTRCIYRNISYLLNISLTSKEIYSYFLENTLKLVVQYKDLHYNKDREFDIILKKVFFTPDWINSNINEKRYIINEDQLIYINAYLNKYKITTLEEDWGIDYQLIDTRIKEFIVPKFLLNKLFHRTSKSKIEENLFSLKEINIYMKYHYLIKFRYGGIYISIDIISLKDQKIIRKINQKDNERILIKKISSSLVNWRLYEELVKNNRINIDDNYFTFVRFSHVFHFFNDIVLNILMKLSDEKIIELFN